MGTQPATWLRAQCHTFYLRPRSYAVSGWREADSPSELTVFGQDFSFPMLPGPQHEPAHSSLRLTGRQLSQQQVMQQNDKHQKPHSWDDLDHLRMIWAI